SRPKSYPSRTPNPSTMPTEPILSQMTAASPRRNGRPAVKSTPRRRPRGEESVCARVFASEAARCVDPLPSGACAHALVAPTNPAPTANTHASSRALLPAATRRAKCLPALDRLPKGRCPVPAFMIRILTALPPAFVIQVLTALPPTFVIQVLTWLPSTPRSQPSAQPIATLLAAFGGPGSLPRPAAHPAMASPRPSADRGGHEWSIRS